MSKVLGTFIFIFLLFSCGEGPEAQTTETVKASSTIAVEKTAMPTKDAQPKPRGNYTVSTARPQSQVQQKYPYDIELSNAQKETFNTKDILLQNGKPTVLVFWLTTCVPCHYELNAMKGKYAQWQEEADFNFYAISTDFQKNYDKFVAQVNKHKWEWPVYHDTNREFRLAMPGELNGLPQTFILDKNGEIVYHKRKYSTGDEDKLFAKVKELASK